MTILLNNMTHLPSILHTWTINGARLGLLGEFRVEASEGGLLLSAPEGIKLKKGDNVIELPTLTLKDVAILLDVSEELLDAGASVRCRHIFTAKENAPVIRILCTEAKTVYSVANIYLLKGSFR